MTDPTIEVTEGGAELPVIEVLTGRGAIFGKSGSGKSNTVGVIAEELLEENFPLLIIDADGEHYGLKEEYEILHVGADREFCDAEVGPEHADSLARLALDENVPIILDVSDYLEGETVDELVRNVARELFRREKDRKVPFPIFLEEAHEFIPETTHPDETAKALIKVAKRGRKRGLGLTAISQRPANVNKDVVTQTDWAVWHLLTWRNDTQVVREVLNPEYAQAVQDLETGEAILDADWEDDPRSVQFKRKRTFDAGETPGLEEFERPELQPISEDVLSSLHEITDEEEAEEERIAELESERDHYRARVETLEEEIERLESGEERGPDAEVVEDLREEKRRLEAKLTDAQDELEQVRTTLEEREETIESLRAEVEDLRSLRDDVTEAREHLWEAQAALGDEKGAESAAIEEEYREQVEELEAEVERLEAQNERLREQRGSQIEPLEGYQDFFEDEDVRDILEEAVEEANTHPKAVKGAFAAIKNRSEALTHNEIAEELGRSHTTDISKATAAMEDVKLVTRMKETGNQYVVDYNFEGIEEMKGARRRREKIDQEIEAL